MFSEREDYNSPIYKSWRFRVYSRDGFCCQNCGKKGVVLNCHHIIKHAVAIHLRYVVSNGITLCKECHDMVTGHEEAYEAKFNNIVHLKNISLKEDKKQKKLNQASGNFKNKMPKWRPRNTKLRF